MSLPNWVTSEAWDTLRLGGMIIPGIARVKSRAPSGLDIKKPKGGKKATTKDDGDPPAEFDCDLSMSHAELVEFADMVGVLRPVTKSGARSPLKADHPQFALLGVYNVSVGKIEVDPPESGGRIHVSIEVFEWSPAPSAVAKSKTQPADNPGDWSGFEDDVAGSGRGPAPPPPAPKTKPSSKAGENI
jgi:hypothetical protein